MAYENVNLWFAKVSNGDIVTIDEINENNKSNYYCPMCGSEVIPKAIKEDSIVSSHFAHIDKSKCNGEGMVHYWFKNKLLIKGDKFIIKTDISHEYICEEVLIEQSYTIGDKVYKPDVTIITECGNKIFFEMNYSNKKKIKDYLDIWLELRNIVVEVDVKALMIWNKGTLPEFKALFYDGKCFNTKKNDLYYNTIGKYKESSYKQQCDIEQKEKIKRLDWFWKDVNKYKKGEIDIEYLVDIIDLNEKDEKDIITDILNKQSCVSICKDYINYKTDKVYKIINDNIDILEDYFSINKFGIFKDYNDKLKGGVEFHDLKERSYSQYDVNKYTINQILDNVKSNINDILLRIKREKELDIARENLHIKNVINKLEKEYKLIDPLYHLYDRFVYGLYISFCYNYDVKVDIDLNEEDSIIYSYDENFIEQFIKGKIDVYMNCIKPIKNKEYIVNILNNLNVFYNKITSVHKREISKKVGKRKRISYFVNDTYNYGVGYKLTSEDSISIYLYKKQIGFSYTNQVGYGLYLHENSIYCSDREHYSFSYNHKLGNDQNIKITTFKSEEDWLKFELTLRNIFSKYIRFDRNNLKL